jgi:hypothetical protein
MASPSEPKMTVGAATVVVVVVVVVVVAVGSARRGWDMGPPVFVKGFTFRRA